MKKYFFFAGDNTWDKSGGWEDFKGAFDTKEEGFRALVNSSYGWYHVVDTATLEIIERG